MDFNHVIQEIDAEIARLQEARRVLTGGGSKRGQGRPKVAAATHKGASPAAKSTPKRKKRRLSAEGRKRIADAMRKRWAERKKQQGSKPQAAK